MGVDLARHAAQVGLFCRAQSKLAPVINGQLLAAYPDLRMERVNEAAFETDDAGVWFSARLRLSPRLALLLPTQHFVDREQRLLADPLAAVLSAIASGRGGRIVPTVTLAVRPVGLAPVVASQQVASGQRAGDYRQDTRAFVGG